MHAVLRCGLRTREGGETYSHDWAGDSGGLPEHHADAQSGEELVVVLGFGPLVGSLHFDHFELYGGLGGVGVREEDDLTRRNPAEK